MPNELATRACLFSIPPFDIVCLASRLGFNTGVTDVPGKNIDPAYFCKICIRWPPVMLREDAQQDNEIGRSQSVTASFNGIVRQLRRSEAYSEISNLQ